MHYVAVIDKDPGSAYGIRFPEAPGCYSAADSFDDIVPNAIEALSLFFEDSEPAPPRGIEAVREQVADSIAEGAVLMMIPYVQDRKRVVRVNLSLEKGFLDTLDEAARLRGMTRSAFVQKAAAREILDPA
ncbi:MAG: CopG family transcriptional regulator [Rhodospirillaceae bacterium]|nr:CopG family transcriptional regulator [Rhodospirillaceae bacterium]MYB12738.1 CopG family transcriptional regulator [Rhodospirillaceae bacterium]MYI49477.1 CopG family transcriptional regulator [Rhodospirillaceae bacterium]